MSLASRLAALRQIFLHRAALEHDLDDEVRAYIDIVTQRYVEQGIPPEAAARRARLELQSPAQIKQHVREARMGIGIENTWRDVRYSLRALRKSPGFTAVAVLTLALGIGANTAIFSLINAVMLRMLPVADPDQLVLLTDPGSSGVAWETRETGVRSLMAFQEFDQLRAQSLLARNKVFAGLCAAQSAPSTLDAFAGEKSAPLRVHTQLVSGDFFGVLGVRPMAGRVFTAEEDKVPGANPVGVISHGFWQREFAGDPNVLGQTLRIGQGTFHIIGIAPPAFHGMMVGSDADIWIPLTMQQQVLPGRNYLKPIDTLWLQVMGRLASGVPREKAQAAINVSFEQVIHVWAAALPTDQERKEMRDQRIELRTGARGTSDVRDLFSTPLLLLMAMVGVVLLIACANIANLMLARASARQREIGVRLALGAARVRLIRQFMTESVLIAIFGGTLGTWFAFAGTRLLVAMASGSMDDLSLDLSTDIRVFLFTAGASLLTGILFGLAPAIRSTRADVNRTLTASARGGIGGRGQARGGRVLVVAQVGLSVILLMGAALFIRSLHKMLVEKLGFDRDGLLLARVDPVTAGYKGAGVNSLYEKLLTRLHTIPGVQAVTISNGALFGGTDSGDPVSLDGSPVRNSHELHARWTLIGPDYFRTIGIPLLRGREITMPDAVRGAQYCLINQSFATKFFPNIDPIGRHVTDEYPTTRETYEIIGIVPDAREHRPDEKPNPRFYASLFHPIGTVETVALTVRTAADPAAIAPSVRQTIQQVDAALPVSGLRTVNEQLGRRLLTQRLIAQLSGFFGIIGLFMAALGLYGVMSYAMSRRTGEIGIRMALGASRPSVIRMVLAETLWMVGAGIAIGLPCAIALGRLISTRLFGLSPADPAAIVLAISIILGTALFAAWLPARRASRIDPMNALRCD